jgi:acid phosphatase
MENREYSSIVGSSSAPYLNSLIAQYGLATRSYAVDHPSEPNYVAFVSGGTQGVSSDGLYNLGADNLFEQVSVSGRTWRAYEQGDPGNCFTGSSSSSVTDGIGSAGSYVRKHNPAIVFTGVSGDASLCANISNLASFDPAAANFEFITPNLVNDMHDGSTGDGDAFLRAFVPEITTSAAFANSLLIITWDEGSSDINGGGHIATIVITPHMTPGFESSVLYNHYSVLRTIEQAWGLPYLGNAAGASPLAFPF